MKKQLFLLSVLAFICTKVSAQLNLTSPNGGENWAVGSSHQITFSGAGSAIIKYSINNGVSWLNISSTSGSPYTWIVPNTPSTQCRVKIQWCGSCVDSSSTVFTISAPTLLSENSFENKVVKIYPNPCSSVLYIEGSANEKSKAEILNVFGEVLISYIGTLSSYSVDISELPSGVYILKQGVGSNLIQKKFIKN